MHHRRVFSLFLCASLARSAGAQSVLEEFSAATSFVDVPHAARIGDIDLDGYEDVIVATSSNQYVQYVRVYSARTSTVLHEYSAIDKGLGWGLGPAGDVDGDGRDDFFVTAYQDSGPFIQDGCLRVLSGANGIVLRTLRGVAQTDWFGWSAASLGDLDGDGKHELVVGVPNRDLNGSNSGQVVVFDGATGAIRFAIPGTAPGDLLGQSVAACGDVDGDGVTDFVGGAPFAKLGGIEKGYARVYSGATGAQLFQFDGVGYQDRFGTRVDGAGDVDGDGHADIVVGAEESNFGFNNSGSATLFSGANGAVMWTVGGGGPQARACIVAGGFDYDGDGTPDVAVGAFTESVVRVHRGTTGAVIQTIVGPGSSLTGLCVAFAGDYDHSGRPDLIVGIPGLAVTRVYSFDAAMFDRVCVAAPNSVGPGAMLDHIGTSSVSADDLVMTASGMPPNKSCILFFGSATLQVPYFDGFRCPSGQILRLPSTQSDAAGQLAYPIDRSSGHFAISMLTAGSTWTFQVLYRDTGSGTWGLNTTDSLRIGFGL